MIWKLGGASDCRTVQVTILRSNEWNGLLLEVPPVGEEPPPPYGNPDPQFGRDLTAQKLYQEQVHNWLAQNFAPPNGASPGNALNNPQGQADGWGVWPPPLDPPMPSHRYIFLAWLTAQGLQVQDGVVRDNNISDSA
ncbi:hypothetical protein D1007_51051 [Hordeum vulgare]|nr:hypothetical protein D1007_51051 [Hordeum vulgare]